MPDKSTGSVRDTGTRLFIAGLILIQHVPVIPSDLTGTIPEVGTIQSALYGPLCMFLTTTQYCLQCSVYVAAGPLLDTRRVHRVRSNGGSMLHSRPPRRSPETIEHTIAHVVAPPTMRKALRKATLLRKRRQQQQQEQHRR